MRENYIMLHGQVTGLAPRIVVDKTGTARSAQFALKVMRRPITMFEGQATTMRLDCPIVMTQNQECIQQVSKLQLYDMVDVIGVICTKEVDKKSYCGECGELNKVKGTVFYVSPIYICQREEQISEADAMTLLKNRAEISNQAFIIGTLCKNPELHTNVMGRSTCQYLVAVNRKYRIREDPADLKTDYLMIKTYGKQADEDYLRLSANSTVYVRGCIQTREIERESVCQHCGQTYKWKEKVSEIVPYSIEYAKYYKTDADLAAEGWVDSEDMEVEEE